MAVPTSSKSDAGWTVSVSRFAIDQAIGRSRGGRTMKIHALTDTQCRPIAFMLTGGQVPDRMFCRLKDFRRVATATTGWR